MPTDPTPERPESPSPAAIHLLQRLGLGDYRQGDVDQECDLQTIGGALDAAREQGRREEESKWSAMLDAGRLVTSGECDSREGAAREEGRREGRDAAAWAAERLCRIYFDIAAEAIGADEVRILRDSALAPEEQKG